MRQILTFSIVATVAVAVAALAADQTSDEPTGQKLQQMEQRWAEGAKKQDVTPLEAMLADDYTLTNPVGQVVGKDEFVGKIKDGAFKIDSADYSDMKVRVYGDAAVVTGRVSIRGSWDGTDVSGNYAFTDTFVKRAGKWQEVAGQVTRVGE